MKIREKIFYSSQNKFSQIFERPKYQHKVHQLPRINPRNAQNPRGYNRNFNKHAIKQSPQVFQTSQPVNQAPIEKATPTRKIPPVKKQNKNANFGYSQTDPLLQSEKEDAKVDFNQRRANTNRKTKPVTTPNPVGANIFDPSKTANLPPPPKPVIKQPPRAGGPLSTAPMSGIAPMGDPSQNYTAAAPTFDQYPPSATPSSGFSAPQYPGHNVEPMPVIAATKVKPPTAQKKPQAKLPMQRYAPPPRLANADDPSAYQAARPAGPPMPGRGNAPRPMSRGAPPMARGGLTRGQAPSPFPQPSVQHHHQQQPAPMMTNAPAPMMTNAPAPMAPPPPKMSRRARQPDQ